MFKQILIPLLLALASAFPLYGANQSQYVKPPNYQLSSTAPTIQILLYRGIDKAAIEVKGEYKVYDPNHDSLISMGLLGKCYPIQAIPHGIKWGEEFPDIYQITIVPDNANLPVFVNGVPYPGIIYVYQIDGTINIVNEVRVEDYVKSILASRLSRPLPEEVTEAIAITVRTDAYYERVKSKNSYWNLDAAQIDYRGNATLPYRKGIREAVDATKFLVLRSSETDECGGLLPATWTGHCAGKTATHQAIFRKSYPVQQESIQSPIAAAGRDTSSWSFSIPKSQLASLLQMNTVSALSLYKDLDSGKVYTIRAKSGSESKDIDFIAFQKLVGVNRLKSNDFVVSIQEETITFNGYGEGHGVGLCLYTAIEMAREGLTAPQILAKFFPHTVIVMMPTLPLKEKVAPPAPRASR